MKNSLLLSLVLIPCLAVASTTTNPPTTTAPSQTSTNGEQPGHKHHHASPEKQLAKLTAKLQLSSVQQGMIKPLLVTKAQQIEAIHENTSLTKEQRHEQIKALHASFDQQLESYLNPAQLAEFKTMLQEHAAKRQ
jgi:molecular chaperone DnaK (HSP70)